MHRHGAEGIKEGGEVSHRLLKSDPPVAKLNRYTRLYKIRQRFGPKKDESMHD